MRERIFIWILTAMLLAVVPLADAQQPKVYRVGVITAGGTWYETIDGLRVGLKQLGMEEKKHFTLAIRDTQGSAKAAEEEAKRKVRTPARRAPSSRRSVPITLTS